MGRTPGLRHNEFLCTTGRFADFTLSVDFRVQGDDTANSGIQFRTQRIPGSREVRGYQADIGQKFWGALYDESRRNRPLVVPRPETIARAARKQDWNTYLIQADGARVTLSLNGVVTATWNETDAGIERDGIICLQLHSGNALEVRFRNLDLRQRTVTRT